MKKSPRITLCGVVTIIFLIISITLPGQSTNPISDSQIRSAAEKFLISKLLQNPGSDSAKNVSAMTLDLVYSSSENCLNKIFCYQSSAGGYVFAISYDSTVIIPAYSLTGTYNPASANPLMKEFINAYESSVISLTKKETFPEKGSVLPLLEIENINWGQGEFYNKSCPADPVTGSNALVGCVATAMGQIMRYHKFPATGSGSYSYSHPVYGTISADFGNTAYNWDNMPGNLTSNNVDVATILFHAGVSVDMYYTSLESGAYSYKVANALNNYFKYPNAVYVDVDNFAFGTNEYQMVLKEELNNNRPFYYELLGDAHAVVIDGYDDDYFHVNFGWDGYENGYFILSGIQAAGGYIFGFKGNSVIGISPVPITANKQDSLALVALYNSTGGPNWYNKANWLSGPLSSWQNVDVINGKVIHLNLNENNLNGTLPTELGNLTNLTNLNIASNYKLVGEIPSSLGQLTNLMNLVLGNNSLTGGIPSELGNCSKLLFLSLGNNKLTGTIPSEIGQLIEMEYLSLNGNQLTGSIPAGILNMTKLKYLNLSMNQLSGELPDNFNNLGLLTSLQLNDNEFSGELPGSIWDLSNLGMFSIQNNKFEGAVSQGIGQFKNLLILKIDNNNFTSIPDEIGQLVNLTQFSAVNNMLTSIPSGIGDLHNLKYLYLQNNKIESLPPEIGKLESLIELRLTNNLLKELPYETGSLNNLNTIIADSNRIESITYGICLTRSLSMLDLSFNKINESLPPLSHIALNLEIDHNSLSFEDIASSKMTLQENLTFDYRNQANIALDKSSFEYAEHDSVGIDIRDISELSHPENNYTWFKNGVELSSGPVISFKNALQTNAGSYYCKVENPVYPLLSLQTDDLTLKLKNLTGAVSDTVISKTGSPVTISDNEVKLITPENIRGEIIWQSSRDTLNWVNISPTMSNDLVKQNIFSVNSDSVVVKPLIPALYRYKLIEDECDPVYSDTVFITAYKAEMLIDTILNVIDSSAVIILKGIEIIIPEKLTADDFRLTVELVETPPASPDSVLSGPVYDVKLSCGTAFSIPIEIRLKVDSDSLNEENHNRFVAVYFDETDNSWKQYDKSSISTRDSAIVFETDHLTKLSFWEKSWIDGDYTDKFVKNGVTVYYKQKYSYLAPLYEKNQTAQPWHLTVGEFDYGTPVQIQDVAYFTREVMDKFKFLGLSVPDQITIYFDAIDDYGIVGLMGMTNGYLTISVYIEEPSLLKSVIAHEYMHYTQDYYILAHPGNIFWMEANGHLADRMVWKSDVFPISESDNYLMENRKGKNSIFNSILNSWDYWDSSILTQNIAGNVDFCYLAGVFIHYMRSYKEGTNLKPEILLKETSYFGSWKSYLDEYISNYLGSTIGDQFVEYIKYIFSGINPKFTVLDNDPDNYTSDPFKYIVQAPEEFGSKHLYKLPQYEDTIPVIKETIAKDLPYLSTKMEQFYNLSINRALCVRYKRTSEMNDDLKVFLCRYNSEINQLEMEDISNIDSSFFFIKAATDENVDKKGNQVFLLMINKSKNLSINANFELEIMPVADFNYLWTSDFSSGINSDIKIHNYNDGIKRNLVFGSTALEYTSSSVYTDSTVVTTCSSTFKTQIINYNFRNGDMTITENYSEGFTPQFSYDYTYILTNDTRQIVLKNIFLVPFSAQYSSSGIYNYQTTNTSDTQKTIVSISNTHSVDYTLSGGGSEHETYTYTGTDWSYSNDITLNLQFK